jgi:hypothetical protein
LTEPLVLRCGVVLDVEEDECRVWTGESVLSVGYVPQFPSPRVERVSPGHLVAFAPVDGGTDVIVWRWYDGVVLGETPAGLIRLWEPAHGEVAARFRQAQAWTPGSRCYLSSGLPGAEWWVAGPVVQNPAEALVELDEVRQMYTGDTSR